MGENSGPSGGLGNMHADVLNSVPEDDAAKARLLEELRRRAKGAFGSKDMRSCDQLYSKAIEFCKTDATLYSNRAMVYLNMNKVDEALKDAESCLALDNTLVKAHYRKAQALERLGRFDAAIEAIEVGKAVKDDPSFVALEEQVLKNKLKDAAQKAEIRRDAQDTANAAIPQAPVSVASMVERQKKKKESAGEDTSMKGYKTRSDGAKTSFFHMEITDEAKALLDAQGKLPQKLEEGAATADAPTAEGKSVWNKAGTWESKDLKKWVQAQLDAYVGFRVDLKAPDGTPAAVEVKSVTGFEGAAEIVTVRGKTRHVLDISFTVNWELRVADTDQIAKGKLIYEDVCVDDPAEVRYEADSESHPAARPLAEMYVKRSGEGLQPALAARMAGFLADFAQL